MNTRSTVSVLKIKHGCKQSGTKQRGFLIQKLQNKKDDVELLLKRSKTTNKQ